MTIAAYVSARTAGSSEQADDHSAGADEGSPGQVGAQPCPNGPRAGDENERGGPRGRPADQTVVEAAAA